MTRAEAISLTNAAMHAPDGVVWCDSAGDAQQKRAELARESEKFVDAAVALGMLKLDEPKSAEDALKEQMLAMGFSKRDVNVVRCALETAGLKIVEK